MLQKRLLTKRNSQAAKCTRLLMSAVPQLSYGTELQRLRQEKLPALRVSVRYAPDQAKNESL